MTHKSAAAGIEVDVTCRTPGEYLYYQPIRQPTISGNRHEDTFQLLHSTYFDLCHNDRTAIRIAGGRNFSGIRVVLREIEDGVLALRNELNLSGTVTSVDTRAMLDTAAKLENLADHLDFDVRQWLNRERPSYSTAALQASDRFVQRAKLLHRALQAYPTAAELKKSTGDLAEEFRVIYQYLGRCNTEHRDHLRLLSEDISQAIYELRVPLQI